MAREVPAQPVRRVEVLQLNLGRLLPESTDAEALKQLGRPSTSYKSFAACVVCGLVSPACRVA